MIQSAQVASKFTLFTHHAKTFPDLVTALRNSMLRAGVFKDERTAEEQVVQVLNFDIHLVKDFRGVRYIERITECIPVEEKNEYTFDHRNEKTLEGKFDKFMDNATIYFGKTTNRELYKYRNIMEYVNDSYVLTNPISDTNIREMRMNMEDTDMVAFDAFLERNWGIKPPKMPTSGNAEVIDLSGSQESVPVSSNPINETEPKVQRTRTKSELEKLAKSKQKLAKETTQKSAVKKQTSARPVRKKAEDADKKVVKKTTKTTEQPKKRPPRSSILGNIDDE